MSPHPLAIVVTFSFNIWISTGHPLMPGSVVTAGPPSSMVLPPRVNLLVAEKIHEQVTREAHLQGLMRHVR